MSFQDQNNQGPPYPLRRAGMSGDVMPARSRPRKLDLPDDDPLDEDIERFSHVTQTCPNCGKEVFDDTDICYHCGYAITRPPGGRSKMWVIITAAIIIVAFLFWISRGLF